MGNSRDFPTFYTRTIDSPCIIPTVKITARVEPLN
nr:MAG TPA: hypothetical protein [Myoviridae sp. ctfuG5]